MVSLIVCLSNDTNPPPLPPQPLSFPSPGPKDRQALKVPQGQQVALPERGRPPPPPSTRPFPGPKVWQPNGEFSCCQVSDRDMTAADGGTCAGVSSAALAGTTLGGIAIGFLLTLIALAFLRLMRRRRDRHGGPERAAHMQQHWPVADGMNGNEETVDSRDLEGGANVAGDGHQRDWDTFYHEEAKRQSWKGGVVREES
jgi:hypothetical protein